MRRRLYVLLIFFLVLSAFSGLFHNSMQLLAGPKLYTFDSFIAWFCTTTILFLIGTILLFRYYYLQKYRVVLVTGIITTVFNQLYAIFFFCVLVYHRFAGYLFPLQILEILTGLIYAVSIVLLRPQRNGWLRAAGGWVAIFELFFSGMMLRNIYSKIPSPTLVILTQWAAIGVSLAPIFLILHFWQERKALPKEDGFGPGAPNWQTAAGLVGLLGVPFLLVFAIMIASESRSSLYWDKWNYEKTKELSLLCEHRAFVDRNGDILRYRLLKPLGYDPTRKYPIVISLPYGGLPGADSIEQMEGASIAEMLATEYSRKKYPAFLFIPDCPPGKGWGGIPDYPTIDTLVLDAILSLDREFGIDDKRRYISGISRGGYGTWHFICMRPDMFAAAIPVSAAGDPKEASKVVGVAIWAFHGEEDKNVPVSGSRDMINAIKNAGGHPKYTEFPTEGHNIWHLVSSEPWLLNWLFDQKKD